MPYPMRRSSLQAESDSPQTWCTKFWFIRPVLDAMNQEAEAEAEAEAHHPIDVAPDPVHQAGAIAPRVIPAADPTAEAPHAPTIVKL